MYNDAKVIPMAKRLKPEKPGAKAPVLWTPWGPQTFAERDAQLDATRRSIRRIRKLERPRKLTNA